MDSPTEKFSTCIEGGSRCEKYRRYIRRGAEQEGGVIPPRTGEICSAGPTVNTIVIFARPAIREKKTYPRKFDINFKPKMSKLWTVVVTCDLRN